MKIKRMVKRLFAVGAGATMLGATVMGAMAADLGNYPDMFVTNGAFNGFFVVGEAAAALDNLASLDIATGMKVASGASTTTATVEGDSWKVGTESKFLELANSNATASALVGEDFRNIVTFIGDDELGALADSTWSTNENDYDYQQFMFFDEEGEGVSATSRIVKYVENDDDKTADHLLFKSSQQIARYKMEFSSTAQSDVTDSTGTSDTTGTYLDDFENTDLNIMGQDYSVVLARRASLGADLNQNGVKLTLMGGSTRDTLLEGEAQTYTVGDKAYEVTVSFVDTDEAKFIVNGESTNKLKVGETYTLSDKSEVGVSEILYQDYAGGVHQATFFVGAQKMILQDQDISAIGTGEKKITIGSEDIDGSSVFITGTDDNTTFTISTIEVNMTADDDFFVGMGEKLSDVIANTGEEKEVLMGGQFDIEYLGLTGETTHDLRLKSSSARRYKLQLFDGDGNQVDIPVAYAEAQYNLTVSEDTATGGRGNDKRLVLNESIAASTIGNFTQGEIFKDDYFVVTGGTQDDATDGGAKSYLLQYKGSDKTSDTSPKIKFKNVGNGETLESSATAPANTGTVATIKVGGHSFIVQNATVTTSDDFRINVDMDGSGAIGASEKLITFVDSYGSECTFTDFTYNHTSYSFGNGNATGEDFFEIRGDSPNTNDYDNWVPSTVTLNITAAAGPEVRASLAGLTLVTPDGETEISYGYTSMGSFVTLQAPSSDPQEITMAYPKIQRLPQVYFTSGATSAGKGASGNMVSVTVVDASKLDSEVSNVEAQNLITVGGPCVNTVSAELMGNPASCAEGFTPGKAMIKLWEHANGNVAMLVAGYSGADTRLAGRILANTPSKITSVGGSEVVIEGTTASDATVGAPTTQ